MSHAYVSSLLSIDVGAEIDKLSRSQLERPERVAIEAVRLLVRAGARRIDITWSRGRLRVQGPGARLEPALLEALALIFDPNATAAARHTAITAFEERHDLAYLALCAARPATLELHGEAGALGLEVDGGGITWHSKKAAPSVGAAVALSPVAPRRRVRAELRLACRFAALPITCDGEALGKASLPDVIVATALSRGGLSAHVGLSDADLRLTCFVKDEVVIREEVSAATDGLVHMAVVRGVEDADAARDLLAEARTRLYGELRQSCMTLPPGAAKAARRLLLRACRAQADTSVVGDAAILLLARGGHTTLASAREAHRRGALFTSTGRAATRQQLPPGTIVLAPDELDRELLRLAGLVVPALGVARRTAGRRLAELVGRWSQRLVGALGGAFLDERQLTAAERAFVLAVRAEISRGAFVPPAPARPGARELVATRRGALPVRVGADGRWRLPVRSQAGARLVRALSADASVLPMIMAALFGGHDGYGSRKSDVHAGWIARGRNGADPLAPPPLAR